MSDSDGSNDTSAAPGHKRKKVDKQRAQHDAAGSKRAKQDPGPRFVTTAAKRKAKAKPTLQPHRLKKKDVPSGAESLKEAYYETMSYMWGLKDSTDFPTLPPADVIAEFNRRFDDKNATDPITSAPPPMSLPQQQFVKDVDALRTLPRVNSRTSNSFMRLEDKVKKEMSEACERHHLSAWRPDFRQSPNTPYNNAHRLVAEEVFEQLATDHAFSHKRVNLVHLKNRRFMRKCHVHYVYTVQRDKWKLELVKPGAIKEKKAKEAIFQRRKRNRDRLWNYLVSKKTPHRFVRAIEDVCVHSDDEVVEITTPVNPAEPNGATVKKKVCSVKIKNLRSARFTRWITQLRADCDRHEKYLKGDQVGRFTSYERVRLPEAPETALLKLPRKTTLDYFDPVEFNALPASIRRLWANNRRVAFPKDDAMMFANPPHPSMTMSDADFKKKYAKAVLDQYNIPDEDEEDDDEYAWTDSDEEQVVEDVVEPEGDIDVMDAA